MHLNTFCLDFAINTILFIRGFSMLSNFTLQFHYDTPIWILTDDNLSHSFKQQLKSLRGEYNKIGLLCFS